MKKANILEAGERTHKYEQPEHGILCAICGNGIEDEQHGGKRTQHTSGPWRVDNDGQAIRGQSADSSRIAVVNYGKAANARLIAAAPELLRELKELVAFIAQYHNTVDASGYIAASEAAIAKAEGK